MTTEINEIIQKNLPAQVGDVLKQRLEQAEKDVKELDQAKKQRELDLKRIEQLSAEILEYKKFDERNASLETKEESLREQERNLKINMLEFQLEVEKNKSDFVREVTMGLVRNTTYKKNVFDSENGPNGRDQYGHITYATNSKNVTETKEEI